MTNPGEPNSIALLVDHIRQAGDLANKAQINLGFAGRTLKSDGSVVTSVDQELESFLTEKIRMLFPAANIIGEETSHEFDPTLPVTFVIDPIDGTDAYSQQMPGWCVCVGVLSRALKPIAGVVYAPAWGAMLVADIGQRVLHNQSEVNLSPPPRAVTRQSNIAVFSRVHQALNLTQLPGKLRSFGSTALHICAPLIHPALIGSISSRVRLWDLVAAHAIVSSAGLTIRYFDGPDLDYSVLMSGNKAADLIVSGSAEVVELICRLTTKLTPSHTSPRPGIPETN